MLQGQVNTIASQARRACRSAVRVAIRINPFKSQVSNLRFARVTRDTIAREAPPLKRPGFPRPEISTLLYFILPDSTFEPGASPFGRACYAASDL